MSGSSVCTFLSHPHVAGSSPKAFRAGGIHMAAEPSANRPGAIVLAAAEKDPLAAECPVAAAANPVCWEFQLTPRSSPDSRSGQSDY